MKRRIGCATFGYPRFCNDSPFQNRIAIETLSALSVNKVPDLGEVAIAELHAKEPGAGAETHISPKTLEYGGRQIRLLMKHLHQRLAVSEVIEVTGHPTGRPDCEGYRKDRGIWISRD